jgi:ABC-type sugar transport system permease subunit
MTNQRRGKRGLTQTQAAAILLLPFLAVYAAFLVYPFFRGVWISLHDWNLLAVAFNPTPRNSSAPRTTSAPCGAEHGMVASLPARSCRPLASSGSGWPFWDTGRDD